MYLFVPTRSEVRQSTPVGLLIAAARDSAGGSMTTRGRALIAAAWVLVASCDLRFSNADVMRNGERSA